MKLRNIYYILLGVLAFSAVACQEDANDWGIEPGHDRLFRTTEFKVADNTSPTSITVSYTHLRAHETGRNLVCRLLLEKKKKENNNKKRKKI